MGEERMTTSTEILNLLRQNQFDAAIPLVTQVLHGAAAESPQRLTEVARDLIRFQGFFKTNTEAVASEGYFRTVHSLLTQLAGPESPAAMAAAENLGGLLGSIGKLDEAIVLREAALHYLVRRFPPDEPRLMMVRDGLSVLYQRAGYEEKLKALYQDVGLCEHLSPADRYLRAHGGRVISAGRPWSSNCHVWLYFDAVLDCERLIRDLGLASCVQVHDHQGTHDGSERGLVCTLHHDGVMGRHPSA